VYIEHLDWDMDPAGEVRRAALTRGSSKKRANAIAALSSGVTPALFLTFRFPITCQQWLAGLLVGLIWANAFEYVYHRWLLHWPHGRFVRSHLLHHASVGSSEEAEHATFGESPVYVVALFLINGLPLLAMNLLFLPLGTSAGVLVGWALYLVAVEEIHWRFHLGGWLPPGLSSARVYHLAHHDIPEGRYNVFLPLFDLLFGSIKPAITDIQLPNDISCARISFTSRKLLIGALEVILMVWAFILFLDYELVYSRKMRASPALLPTLFPWL
jgi:fatty acid hydroxylase family protein